MAGGVVTVTPLSFSNFFGCWLIQRATGRPIRILNEPKEMKQGDVGVGPGFDWPNGRVVLERFPKAPQGQAISRWLSLCETLDRRPPDTVQVTIKGQAIALLLSGSSPEAWPKIWLAFVNLAEVLTGAEVSKSLSVVRPSSNGKKQARDLPTTVVPARRTPSSTPARPAKPALPTGVHLVKIGDLTIAVNQSGKKLTSEIFSKPEVGMLLFITSAPGQPTFVGFIKRWNHPFPLEQVKKEFEKDGTRWWLRQENNQLFGTGEATKMAEERLLATVRQILGP